VRYQLLTAWPVSGQHCIEAGTLIDLNQPETAWTQCERWAAGHTPPISALALDWDCALEQHRAYEGHRHLLRRNLHPFHEELLQQILRGKIKMLTREQCRQAQTLTDLERIARDQREQVRRKRERYSTMW
jgi:hypothetical protein